MDSRYHFCCTECGAEHPPDPALLVCPSCAAHQQAGGETRGVLEVVMHDLPSEWPDAPLNSADFLCSFLPVAPGTDFAPLAVGGTPLLAPQRLRELLGTPQLFIKDDTRNPSGSTKDRASLLVAAKARDYGYTTIAAASTGNAATALAAVCAAEGLTAIVFVPRSAPPAKLVQIMSYGATLVPVDGSYDDAFELCLHACVRFGWYNRNTALNPFTIEGKKTAALEIAAQLAPAEAEVVVVPTGDGVIISGVGKGFADLREAGLIRDLPRLVAVQPEGSSAIARALISGAEAVTAQPGAHSVADSLTVDTPRNARHCLKQVRASRGCGILVSDDEIIAAIGELARHTGVFAEPAAAAALAGVRTALRERSIDRDERIVLLITGTGLKDIPAAQRGVRMPEAIPPTMTALEDALHQRSLRS